MSVNRREMLALGGAAVAAASTAATATAHAAPAVIATPQPARPVVRVFVLMGVATSHDGSRDLLSPVNDVLDTLRTLVRTGQDLSRCYVATSPQLSIAEVADFCAVGAADPAAARQQAMNALGPVTFGQYGCTRQGMDVAAQTAQRWMNEAQGVPHLMLTWSGHTVWRANVLMLCPSDMDAWGNQTPRPWPYVGMLGSMGVAWTNKPFPVEARNDHSVFAIIDGCDAGGTGRLLQSEQRREMVLTATNADLAVRERLLGGAWRGLLTWAVNRVLEQHNFIGGTGPASGFDLSYGHLLQSVRALVTAIQGSVPQAAYPEMHGLSDRDGNALNARVLQRLDAAAGATHQYATRLGGRLQLWGDIDHINVYGVYVNDQPQPWARVAFFRSDTHRSATYRVGGQKHVFEANQEHWFYTGRLSDRVAVTKVRFTVIARSKVTDTGNVMGIASVEEGLKMGRSLVAPVFPDWKPVAAGTASPGYVRNPSTGYAIRLRPGAIEWLRPVKGPSPFDGQGTGASIVFDGRLDTIPSDTVACQAMVPKS